MDHVKDTTYKKPTTFQRDQRLFSQLLQDAKNGCANSQYALAVMYVEGGNGVEKDGKKAFDWCMEAYRNDHADAPNILGELYQEGLGVEKNLDIALEYFQEGERNGSAFAANNLGKMYLHGIGVDKDFDVAMRYFQLAADRGNAYAYDHIGLMYEHGYGVSRDCEQAKHYYQLAIDRGCPNAISSMECLLYSMVIDQQNKQPWNAPIDAPVVPNDIIIFPSPENKLLDLEKLAGQGNATACIELGNMYKRGDGVGKNDIAAFHFYEKACELGSPVGFFHMGVMYRDGIGPIQSNPLVAMEYFQKAIDGGHDAADYLVALGEHIFKSSILHTYKSPQAACKIGVLCLNGWYIKQNEQDAVRYLNAACQMGDKDAPLKLGEWYAKEYVKNLKNSDKNAEGRRGQAIHYLKIAALSGNQRANFPLATLYEVGPYACQQTAYKYFELAALHDKDPRALRKVENTLLLKAAEALQKRDSLYAWDAWKIYSSLADAGSAEAMFQCALMMGLNKFNEKTEPYLIQFDQERRALLDEGDNYVPTEYLLSKAASAGHPYAAFKLAEFIESGRSFVQYTPKDRAIELIKWYSQASREHHGESSFKLGMMYIKPDEGMKQYLPETKMSTDAATNKGIELLKLAYDQGYLEAATELSKFYKSQSNAALTEKWTKAANVYGKSKPVKES